MYVQVVAVRVCLCRHVPGARREWKQQRDAEARQQERERERERKRKKIVEERKDFKEREKMSFEIILSSFSLQIPHFSNTGFIPFAHYET